VNREKHDHKDHRETTAEQAEATTGIKFNSGALTFTRSNKPKSDPADVE